VLVTVTILLIDSIYKQDQTMYCQMWMSKVCERLYSTTG